MPVLVSSKHNGFRRAGRAWSTTPEEISLEDITEEQLTQLKSDPLITVGELVASEPEPSERQTLILDVFNRMLTEDPDKANDDWWTQTGKPELKYLRAETGLADISAQERDELAVDES